MANISVDRFMLDGCGRCKWHATPKCKVNKWRDELILLRKILNQSGLIEELKWGMPCYTYKENNILILAAFKESCNLNFFKGTLLSDVNNYLESPGKNSNYAMYFKFRSVEEIESKAVIINDFIKQAIQFEKDGVKVEKLKVNTIQIPDELNLAFEEDELLKQSFFNLTPGRQRGYILYFSQAKQSKTISSRIEKFREKIISGKGFQD